MKLTRRLIETITEKNLEMLFGTGDFRVNVAEADCGSIIVEFISDEYSASVPVKIEIRNDKVIAIQFYTDSVGDDFLDLVTVVYNVQNKIEEFAAMERIIFETPEFVVSNFRELGIDYPDGTRRDLLVKYNNAYSLISFTPDGQQKLVEMNESDIPDIIKKKINEDCHLDLNSARIAYYVDQHAYDHLID